MHFIRQISGMVILVIFLGCLYSGVSFAAAPAAALSSPATDIEAPAAAPVAVPHTSADSSSQDGHHGGHEELGTRLPLWSCLPFAGMLLSIAFMPLAAPNLWHHHFGKIAAFWALSLALPFLVLYKGTAVYEILHIMLADYVPFIILIWSLYTVSGGILLRGTLRGTPLVNVAMLTIGVVLASWMGTTGAAMLMIRPFLRANKDRKNRTFMVVFFIFLVANIGGSLTPLGDPPLFLGFLHGVSFFWTFNILPHMLTMTILLLGLYLMLDLYFYKKEQRQRTSESPGRTSIAAAQEERVPLSLEGKLNFLFLLGIIGAVLFSGIADLGHINTFGVHRETQSWLRDLLLVALGLLSLLTTSAKIRQDNEFTWFPIKEVAYLFVGIFITMIPCLLILKAGAHGALGFIINRVTEPVHYFWVSGLLSAFLDNAPTYLTFFNTALGSFFAGMSEPQAVPLLMTEKSIFLEAISAGAVFFGACSYIGNAPNFMVRAISEEAGTPMPSFFGYILGYTLVFLVPCLILVTWIFF